MMISVDLHVLNLLFHWSLLIICTSIVFRDRGIVMWQSLLFSQLIKYNLSNRCGIARWFQHWIDLKQQYLRGRAPLNYGLRLCSPRSHDINTTMQRSPLDLWLVPSCLHSSHHTLRATRERLWETTVEESSSYSKVNKSVTYQVLSASKINLPSAFNYFAIVDDQNLIRVYNCGQPTIVTERGL